MSTSTMYASVYTKKLIVFCDYWQLFLTDIENFWHFSVILSECYCQVLKNGSLEEMLQCYDRCHDFEFVPRSCIRTGNLIIFITLKYKRLLHGLLGNMYKHRKSVIIIDCLVQCIFFFVKIKTRIIFLC